MHLSLACLHGTERAGGAFSDPLHGLQRLLARFLAGDGAWRDASGCRTRPGIPPRVWRRHGAFLAGIARGRNGSF